LRSPRVAVKDCRWRTASWMVFSFQFEVFLFSVLSSEHPPFLLPDSWAVTFFFTASLYLFVLVSFLFLWRFDSFRFESMVDSGLSLAGSSVVRIRVRVSNTGAHTTVSLDWPSATDRWQPARLTNLPTYQLPNLAQEKPKLGPKREFTFGCFLRLSLTLTLAQLVCSALLARFFN